MFEFLSNIWSSVKGQASDYSEENIQSLNPKFAEFDKLSPEEQESYKNSIFERWSKENTAGGETFRVGWDNVSAYSSYVYGGVQSNKPSRLDSYRKMAQFPEVSDAIDEICDASLNYDENDDIVELSFNEDKLKEVKASEIQEQYEKYINLFKLEHNFYDYMRLLVTEGELSWENIIDSNNKEAGIIGINYIPTESYEFLIDDKGGKQGITVYLNEKTDDDPSRSSYATGGVHVQDLNGYHENRDKKSEEHIAGQEKIELSKRKGVPMKWDQVTYVDSGTYNTNRLVVYPVLEKSRKAYRQLSLIEDAIIIYRLVRAPIRLIFSVDTGKLPFNKAMQEVNKLMKRYQTRKFYNPLTGSVSNDYDPYSMLENFWFPKSEGGGGTTVDKLDQGVNWTELPDLMYFQRKLYLSLKIPFESRIKDPKVKIERGDSISVEEYRFAKFIMKLQDRFSIGFTKGFITHLKLTGIWDQYELNENDVKIKFVAPSSYSLYEQSRTLKAKIESYDVATKEHPEISKEISMRRFLGWSEEEISENNERVEKEALFAASLEFKKDTIKANGSYIALAQPKG